MWHPLGSLDKEATDPALKEFRVHINIGIQMTLHTLLSSNVCSHTPVHISPTFSERPADSHAWVCTHMPPMNPRRWACRWLPSHQGLVSRL